MEKITTTKMTYKEFDQLVKATWPDTIRSKTFESVCEFEWNNDEEHLYQNVTSADYENEQEDFAAWLAGEKYTGVGPHPVLSALVSHGKLDAGNYLIQVWW